MLSLHVKKSEVTYRVVYMQVRQMRLLGSWPGLAALVALANVLGVNIAVVQGGDTGGLDIQHIAPFETDDKCFDCGIVLSYLYCGHYDAASYLNYMRNPEYAKWQEQNMQRDEASERLARRLADEDAHTPAPTSQRSTQPHGSELDLHHIVRPICNDRDVTSILDRNRWLK